MTNDPFDVLRASNPVPYGSSAPPIERVLARIHAEGSARRRWSSWTAVLLPALGIATTLAVVAVALVALHPGGRVAHYRPAATSTTSPGPSPIPVLPAGGMRGLVFVYGAAFPSSSDGLISLQQCLSCHNGDPTAHPSEQDWLASTADGGASWRVLRRPWYVFEPSFSGGDGWAEGLDASSDTARFYVTHDDGRSWNVAPSAAPAMGDQNVSVGGGEVWAIGSACNPQCAVTVLHGPDNGSRLMAAPAQPISGGWTNVEAVAAGPHTAYVTNPDAAGQSYVTHDDGRSWQRISASCPPGGYGKLFADGSPGSLWATCEAPHRRAVLSRSTDGGLSWHVLHGRFSSVFRVQPVSAEVAWGLTPQGAVVRTTDGGATWSTVWPVEQSQQASLRSPTPSLAASASGTPMLTAQSGSSATVLMIVTCGRFGKQAKLTNLAVYRTEDGGQTWQPSIVRLPGR